MLSSGLVVITREFFFSSTDFPHRLTRSCRLAGCNFRRPLQLSTWLCWIILCIWPAFCHAI